MFKVCLVNVLSDNKTEYRNSEEEKLCFHMQWTEKHMEENFYRERIIRQNVTVSHLLANELLSQEFPCLKHVRNVVEWTETLVFVLVLLL